jgi:hypothetical protein
MQVWPRIKIFLCLWHVKRAWLKQACIKINDVSTHVNALKVLENIIAIRKWPFCNWSLQLIFDCKQHLQLKS